MTHATAGAAPAETRVSTLIGDRLCIKCGYNLVGQPINRESHYDMLIIRCPECATVASVQEYPLLGRWANRWAALLAGLWLLVLIALWLATSLSVFGLSLGAAEIASDHYGNRIYEKFSAWQMQLGAQQALGAASGQIVITGPGGQRVTPPAVADFTSWWKQQDKAALLREAGGLFSGFNWFVWYLWMWTAITGLALGIMWATLLIARGRWGLLAWALVLTLTAALIGLIPMMDWFTSMPGWTHRAAQQQVAPITMGLSLAWAWVWLTVGVLIGRSVARGFVRLMLPPRLRSSLAFLWLTDGLEPPTARQTSKLRN